jgi:hypothetical protein
VIRQAVKKTGLGWIEVGIFNFKTLSNIKDKTGQQDLMQNLA